MDHLPPIEMTTYGLDGVARKETFTPVKLPESEESDLDLDE